MPPDDQFDLDAAIDAAKGAGTGAKNAVDNFDLDAAIANARHQIEENSGWDDRPAADPNRKFVADSELHNPLRPEVGSEGDLPWYRQLVTEPIRRNFTPNASERASDEQGFQQHLADVNAQAPAFDEAVSRATSSPAEFAKTLGRGAVGLGGQYGGAALGFAPATSPVTRTVLGAVGGGIAGGTEALARGASLDEATDSALDSATVGLAATGLGEAAGHLGPKVGGPMKERANVKLASQTYPREDIKRARARYGEPGVAKLGQSVRDEGISKPTGIMDYFEGANPRRYSKNASDALVKAGPALESAEHNILDAPIPGDQTVRDLTVDIDPLRNEMEQHARNLEAGRAKPSGPRAYREISERVLSDPKPRVEDSPTNYSEEPVSPESQSLGPQTPSPPVNQLPREPGVPAPEENLLSSEPAGPIEGNVQPPSAPVDTGSIPLPKESGPMQFENQSRPRAWSTGMADMETSPMPPDMSFEGTPRNPARDAGAVSSMMGPPPATNALDEGMIGLPPARDPNALPLPQGEVTRPEGTTSPLGVEPAPNYWRHEPADFLDTAASTAEVQKQPPQHEDLLPAPGAIEPSPRLAKDGPSPDLQLDTPPPDFHVQQNIPWQPLDLETPRDQSKAPYRPENQRLGPIQRGSEEIPPIMPGPGESAPWSPLKSWPNTGEIEVPKELPKTGGYTIGDLWHMRKTQDAELKSSAFGAQRLNQPDNYAEDAQKDLVQGARGLLRRSVDSAVEQGFVKPEDAASLRAANKTFSTIAKVSPHVADQVTTLDNAKPNKSESQFGATKAAATGLLGRMGGVNSMYGMGDKLERAGGAAAHAAELARQASGLGYFNQQQHPEIEQAKRDNPQAPKDTILSKANDAMKESLMGSWYNTLVDKASGLFQ